MERYNFSKIYLYWNERQCNGANLYSVLIISRATTRENFDFISIEIVELYSVHGDSKTSREAAS